MHEQTAFNLLTAWRLLDANRIDEALQLCEGTPSFASLIAHLGKYSTPLAESMENTEVAQIACKGWKQYFNANYVDATDTWKQLYPCGISWLDAWLAIGFAKVGTDVGRFGNALGWAGVAAAHARDGEHLDQLAAACGTRGEILLRGGRPLAAAEAFAEDIALLPPGNRYRGRVRCYRAHAWARLGKEGEIAAEIAYRQAAHSPHERSDPYAWAGLALLAADCKDAETINLLLDFHLQNEMPGAWMHVAAVKVGCRPSMPTLALAAAGFGDLYRWERRWLHAWAASLGVELSPPPALCRHDIPELPEWAEIGMIVPSQVDLTVDPEELENCGFVDMKWPGSEDAIWQSRQYFMP